MGHLSFYNKNQIRDKLLLVLIFFGAGEVAKWQGYGIGLEKQYYMLRNAEDGCCIMCEYYDVCRNDGTLE